MIERKEIGERFGSWASETATPLWMTTFQIPLQLGASLLSLYKALIK